jgi:AmmeMemoRadiSam system protein B
MNAARQPAVAGMFYPADPAQLGAMIDGMLASATTRAPAPKAVIAPHAGYIYSGPVAASVYARVANARDRITRVVLLGPSHRVALLGLALPTADSFVTPLGTIILDRAAIEHIQTLPQVRVLDDAHRLEHSLEVHLPFLQKALTRFSLVPLVVGEASAEEVAEVLDLLWGGRETLIVVSSDLSHYHDYATAKRLDKATSDAIERLDESAIHYDHACGRNPIAGLLHVARRRHLRVHTVDLRNSGDTAGPKDQVVGYGAYIFESP